MFPDWIVLIISAFVFVGILTAFNLLYWSWRSSQAARSRDLARRLGTLTETQQESLFLEQKADPLTASLGSLGNRLEGLLKESGSNFDMSGLIARMVGLAIIGAFMLSILLKGAAGLIGIVFGAIPLLILSARAEERARKLSEQLPDGLDLVARSLQAGHGFSDALRMCAVEMHPPLATEFARVHEENNLGRDFRDCLDDLCKRNPRNFDLRIFVSSVLLQRDTGGNLIEILNNISRTIRARFIFERKVSSLTSEARTSAYILGGLPFLVTAALIVLRPDYLAPLIKDPIGQVLLAFCIGNFLLGVLVMRSLSRIEI